MTQWVRMTDLGNIYPFPMTSWHLQEYLMSGFFSQTSTFTTSFLSSSEEFSPTSSPTKHKEATILHNHQRQFKICSIVKYFNDCSVKILPSSSSPIEKTFAMFLYLLPTRSVLLTCLLRTITKQNMNYMYKFCPNMYLISVKRHFHSIWTHQTFTDFNNTDFEFWRSYIIKQINAYLATCTIIFIFCGNLIKSDKCFGVTFLTCLMGTLKDSPFLCLVFILYIIC